MSQEGQKDNQGQLPPEPLPVHPAIIQKARSSNCVGLSASPLSALNTPEPVRYSLIPDLPLDSSLMFEFLLVLYLLFIQYITI
ncbi:hypothetical protein J4Q44_G00058420 [Coregonus suidteri]|uniref:Uncharacterized protein n=1 Tax=Coregonus suidteri TaxID=861788 RepID=A0AAN8M2G8_9TELE